MIFTTPPAAGPAASSTRLGQPGPAYPISIPIPPTTHGSGRSFDLRWRDLGSKVRPECGEGVVGNVREGDMAEWDGGDARLDGWAVIVRLVQAGPQ